MKNLPLFVLLFFSLACQPWKSYEYAEIKSEHGSPECLLGRKKGSFEEKRTKLRKCPDSDLDLQAALKILNRNNPSLQAIEQKIVQAEAALDQAKAAFWPRVSLFSEYTQGDSPSAYLFKKIDQRQLPPQADFNDPGWFENYESGVEVRMNLFAGGEKYLQTKSAEVGKKISRLSRKQALNRLKGKVIELFFSGLAAKKFINIAEKSVNTVKKELEHTQVRYKAGGAPKSDLLSMQVRLSQAREDLVQAENKYQEVIAGLASVLGLSAEQEFSLNSGQSM